MLRILQIKCEFSLLGLQDSEPQPDVFETPESTYTSEVLTGGSKRPRRMLCEGSTGTACDTSVGVVVHSQGQTVPGDAENVPRAREVFIVHKV